MMNICIHAKKDLELCLTNTKNIFLKKSQLKNGKTIISSFTTGRVRILVSIEALAGGAI